ncbi:ANKRD52 [Symbiodinium microadriaticum]|nr:ANKRD52 [Symbiodinium microadriaticum]
MAPIHWAAMKGNEACLRILLERGADVDCLNSGLNSPLLLAAAFGHDTLARILIEKGADPFVRNLKDRDAVFMAVVYGHASKGLPWTLQLLDSKGMDLNQVDSLGATPLHVCAEKNLARPVRMLVDAGANVNVKHQKTGLTPLQMACSQKSPDVETIRSFLDKGAYANWRDFQGRTAFELVINVHNRKKPAVLRSATASSGSAEDYDMADSSTIDSGDVKWRPMEETIEQVGNWAVRALPVILEIVKKGGRFDPKHLEGLRPSFREAVQLARTEWAEKREGTHFTEFVLAREQAGEDLRLRKAAWIRDDASYSCQLCAEEFGLKNRRHHCRACGSLACDFCSTKRLRLTVIDEHVKEQKKTDNGEPGDNRERVCDGCFNRLMHEASQPSPDHPRVRELKLCAMELMEAIGDLVEALDDPHGDPTGMNAALRMAGLGGVVVSRGAMDNAERPVSLPVGLSKSLSERHVAGTPPRGALKRKGSAHLPLNGPEGGMDGLGKGLERITVAMAGEELIDAIRRREEKLTRAENLTMKFLEASDGYHRIAKKLIQQKTASNRLWGLNI